MLNKKGCECLNQTGDHPFTNAVFSSADNTYLESDADEQVRLNFSVILKSVKGNHQ